MTASAVPTPRQPAPLYRAILRGVVVGSLLAIAVMLLNIFAGNNLHTVVSGHIYRASQMSGPALERTIQRLGIRTVINLRGPCPDMDWYRDECQVTHRLGVSQEDIPFSAGQPLTSAIYFFLTCRDENCAANLRCASSVFATTIRPLVSLSKRCTIPGLASPPSSLNF